MPIGLLKNNKMIEQDILYNDNSHLSPYRWVMLALLWLVYLSFGLLVRSIFPLVTPIIEELGISFTQMGIILGSWQLTYILVSLVAGSFIDRWGVRKSLLAGIIVMGTSTAFRYFADSFEIMLLAVALFGAGGPMISIAGPKIISEWFIGQGRGTAIGIYMTGPWIGGFLSLALTNSLIMPLMSGSWRLTFVFYGIITIIIGVLWIFFARESSDLSITDKNKFADVFRHLIKVRNVQILLIMALCTFTVGHGFTSWLPKILENGGLSASEAGFAASIPLLTAIPTLIMVPRFIKPDKRRRIISFFALVTALMIIFIVNASGNILIPGLALLGAFNCAFMPLMLLILMDTPEVGQKHMGSAGGMFFCIAEIGGFTGPLVMGLLVDITDTFFSGVVLLAFLCIVISIMTKFVR